MFYSEGVIKLGVAWLPIVENNYAAWVTLIVTDWAKTNKDSFPNFEDWMNSPEWMIKSEIEILDKIENLNKLKTRFNR